MKRVVSIQDISCFGKCSLTVALPIISAMGVETAVIPTAVLSTHTGGFEGFTFRDLTEDIPAISAHWKKLGLNFDGIYTGYLGSKEQIGIISELFDDIKGHDTKIIVDPVMGDGGRFYVGFDSSFADEMRNLCKKADIILPNMTEVSFLLGMPYAEEYNEDYVKSCLKKLTGLGCKTAVITGVCFDGMHQGAVAYDGLTGTYYSSFGENIPQPVHGTGDMFASVFTGAMTLCGDLQKSLDIAVKYVVDCIKKTLPIKEEHSYGAAFELCIDRLVEYAKQLNCKDEKHSGDCLQL